VRVCFDTSSESVFYYVFHSYVAYDVHVYCVRIAIVRPPLPQDVPKAAAAARAYQSTVN